MIVLYNLLAGLTHIKTIITKHTADDDQFFVIDLQDITDAERVFEDFLRIELLAQIDVADAQTVLWGAVEELTDILT